MIRSFRAEMRKIWTVRSTYVIALLVLIVAVGIAGFWAYGYKDVGHAAKSPGVLLDLLYGGISTVGVFVTFIALLSVGHEYRYNTILYSLTNINRRSKLFVTKWLAVTLSALFVAAIALSLCGVGFYIGQHVHHINTMAQTMPGGDFVWRAAASIVGLVSLGYIIAMLLRSQVGAIAAFLVLPTTVESLLGLLLKDNIKYLPFTAVGNLSTIHPSPSLSTSLTIAAAYIAGFWLLAYVLFLRRDAN